jgi:uncharacterized protein (TIGR02246 family)
MTRTRTKKWLIYAAAMGIMVAATMTALGLRAQSAVAAQSSLEARLQRLEDEQAIRNLLVEYGNDLDTQDLEGYSKLFAKDGTWTGGIGSAKGPDGIFAMLQKALAKAPPYDPAKVRSFHLLTNFHIQVDGDKATARSKWTFFGRSDDNKLVPRLAGHYDDTFVREDGKWKFKSRVAPHDIPNPDEAK